MDGHCGIAAAIHNPGHSNFTVRWTPPQTKRDDPTYLLRSKEGMAIWDPLKPLMTQAQVPEFFRTSISFIEKILLHAETGDRFSSGGELQFDREWPLEFGLGSSSALVAGFCELAFSDKALPQKWHFGKNVIQAVQSPRASALDLAAQLKGGLVYVKNHEPRGLQITWPDELLVLHGGNKANTTDWIQNKSFSIKQLNELGDSSAQFLKNKDWVNAINSHASTQEGMDIWPEDLRALRTEWLAGKKVDAIKSCGAGGGDAWLIWASKEKHDDLINEASERGYRLIRYVLSVQGTRKEQ